MWVLGHTASAYLMAKCLCKIGKQEFHPRLILLVMIFGNILDATHIGGLRSILHSIIGAIIFIGIILFFFRKMDFISSFEVMVLSFSAGMHILTDWLFSTFQFLWPFSTDHVYLYGFNSVEHIIVGDIIGIIFLTVILISKDFKSLKTYIKSQLIEVNTQSPKENHRLPQLYIIFLILFIGFSELQYLLYVGYFILFMEIKLWYNYLFLLEFTAFSFIFLTFGLMVLQHFWKRRFIEN